MQIIKIRLYEPLETGGRPLADFDINSDITALSWTHTLPGGPNTLEVGIAEPELRAGWGTSYAFIPHAIRVLPGAHVLVSVGGVDVWEGRVQEIEQGPLGDQGFIADGYSIAGTNTDYYESSNTTPTTTSDIIGDIISAAAPLINQGSVYEFEDPMVSHMRIDFDQLTLAESLDMILAEGGDGYVTWDWWLGPGRRLALHPRRAPDVPDYWIPYQPDSMSIRRNYRDIITSAKVAYTYNGIEYTTDEDVREATVTKFGFTRRVRIQADELSTTGAEQLRTTELARRSDATLSITVDRGPGDDAWMTTPSGAPIPHWLVRAGQWVKVANLEPQIIVSVNYAPSDGLALELGAASRLDFTRYLASTCTEVNKLAKGVNPKTGGRRRSMRQQGAIAHLTDSTGLPAGGTLAALSGTTWNATQRDIVATNVASLNDRMEAILAALENVGITA